MKSCKRIADTAFIAVFAAILICGTGPAWAKKTIIFADFGGWDSAQVHKPHRGIHRGKGHGVSGQIRAGRNHHAQYGPDPGEGRRKPPT